MVANDLQRNHLQQPQLVLMDFFFQNLKRNVIGQACQHDKEEIK